MDILIIELLYLIHQNISGDRGGKLLPKLLKPGELVTKEQKDVFKREAGIDGLGDIGRLIEVVIANDFSAYLFSMFSYA